MTIGLKVLRRAAVRRHEGKPLVVCGVPGRFSCTLALAERQRGVHEPDLTYCFTAAEAALPVGGRSRVRYRKAESE
jgi:hypothetical protein